MANQTQALITQVAALQWKAHAQPHQVSTVKVRALIGKEWDPATWNGDVWEDPDEAGDTEFVNSGEPFLPEGTASPFPAVATYPLTPRHQPFHLCLRRQILSCLRQESWPPLRQLPGKILLILLKTHPQHPYLLLDL